MQQYFIDQNSFINKKIYGDDFHHITNVMRMNINDLIIVCYDGKCYEAKITFISKKELTFEIEKVLQNNCEMDISVTILQGYPKADKMEFICQKATELGADAFLPCLMERSVVKFDEERGIKKTARLQKIVKEAAEQSHRNILPQVYPITKLTKVVFSDYDVKILAYEEDAKDGEKSALKAVLRNLNKGSRVLIAIGPEGGISNQEYAFFKGNGFISCALGPRILRTETAALYFLAALSYERELK